MWAAQVQFEGFHTPQKLPPLNALSKMVFRQGPVRRSCWLACWLRP